jgi:hypothetical protein
MWLGSQAGVDNFQIGLFQIGSRHFARTGVASRWIPATIYP